MLGKLIRLISAPFKRLKVFYQIMILAGVMFVFLGIEGLMGITTINRLNQYSHRTFDNGIQLIFKVNEFKTKFEQLRINYLKDIVTHNSTAGGVFYREKSIWKGDLHDFERMHLENINELEKEVATIEKILEKPVSEENYSDLDMTLRNVKYFSENIMGQVRSESLVSLNQGERYSDTNKLISLILLIVGIALAVLLGFAIAIPIARPLHSVGITAKSLAAGNLAKTITAEGSIEVATVVESLNKAIIGLRELVGKIDEHSNTLFIASQELKTASNDTGKSATEVAIAMQELAQASTDQAGKATDAVTNINVLAELVRQVSEEVKNISGESENVALSAKLGQKATNDVADEMIKIYNMTKDVTLVIDELDKFSTEVTEITSMMEGIAEQTALLALNASIEAARAGEHGKGFAVVAMETGKLADQSKQAAQLIGNLIGQMKDRSQQAVRSVTNGMKVVESGKNLATDATITFENIFNKLSTIVARIDSVALSAKRMADCNESMISTITGMAMLSEESMASTEEVSAIAEQQSASVEEVNALAENLADISSRLKQSVAQFELNSI